MGKCRIPTSTERRVNQHLKAKPLHANKIFEFIHIGKTGGGTVVRKLQLLEDQWHLVKLVFDPRKKYIIWVRNPVARFVSSYNYLRAVEYGPVLTCFKNANELALVLTTHDAFTKRLARTTLSRYTLSPLHENHLYFGIGFYLADVARHCSSI